MKTPAAFRKISVDTLEAISLDDRHDFESHATQCEICKVAKSDDLMTLCKIGRVRFVNARRSRSLWLRRLELAIAEYRADQHPRDRARMRDEAERETA